MTITSADEEATALAGRGRGRTESGASVEVLSWNRYSTWTKCAREYFLKYVEKVEQQPQGALHGGRVVHSVAEGIELGLVADSRGQFKFEWDRALAENPGIRWGGRKSKEYPNAEDADWWFKQGPRMLDNYFAIREMDEEQGRTIMQGPNGPVIEAHVVMNFGAAHVSEVNNGGNVATSSYRETETQATSSDELGQAMMAQGSVVAAPNNFGGGHGVQGEPATSAESTGHETPPTELAWQGYLDAMMVDEHGPIVRDLKTGSTVQPYTIFQLASYALAWTRTTGEIVERGEVVPLRKHRKRVEYDLRPALALVEPMYRNLAHSIQEATVFPASLSNLCRSCSVRHACPEGSVMYPEEE